MQFANYFVKDCLAKATAKNPISSQKALIEAQSRLEKDIYKAIYYPQVKLEAQATYQSDVMSIPLKVPGISIPTPAKDQYQAALSVNQVIYEGGLVSSSIDAQSIESNINLKNIELSNQKIKETFTDLYFAALLLDGNIKVYNNLLSI